MRPSLFALPVSLVAAPALAQVEDRALWLTSTGKVRLDQRTRIDVEAAYRFSDNSRGLYESLWIGGATREIAKDVAVQVTYARVNGYSGGRATNVENRVRAQVEVTRRLGRVRLAGRLRLEYRSRTAADMTGFRLRPRIKAALPIAPRDVSLVASHESIVELNNTDWGQMTGADRMRNLIAINWQASEALSFEAGYLNQYHFARGGDRPMMDHILSLSTTLSL